MYPPVYLLRGRPELTSLLLNLPASPIGNSHIVRKYFTISAKLDLRANNKDRTWSETIIKAFEIGALPDKF
jgi:hypothetical protein